MYHLIQNFWNLEHVKGLKFCYYSSSKLTFWQCNTKLKLSSFCSELIWKWQIKWKHSNARLRINHKHFTNLKTLGVSVSVGILIIQLCVLRVIYEVCSKRKVTFQISRATSVRSSIFLCDVGTLVPNICTQFQVYSIFNLFLTDPKVRRSLVCSAIFCYQKKMDQRICIKFCVKNGIN